MTLQIQADIRSGSTRVAMGALVLASAMQALQLATIPADWLDHPRYQAMFGLADVGFWLSLHAVCAAVMAWRLCDRNVRLNAAIASNAMMFMAWFLTYTTPAWFDSGASLASPIWVFPILAMWVLVRTIATPADRAKA